MDDIQAQDLLESGDKWRDDTTRLAFPLLLWCAINGKRITYGQLDTELVRRHRVETMPRKTVYGHPAGRIGNVLKLLSDQWGETIPPLNALIVEQKSMLPSDGVDSYLRLFLRKKWNRRLTEKHRDSLAEETIAAVHRFRRWRKVGQQLGVEIPRDGIPALMDEEQICLPPIGEAFGTGESEAHKALKDGVANNPGKFQAYGQFSEGETEYSLRSGDRVDVVFINSETILGVEVKAANASDAELCRGIFQCVKYQAVLRAEQTTAGDLPNASAILVTECPLPRPLKDAAKRLGVEWLIGKQP